MSSVKSLIKSYKLLTAWKIIAKIKWVLIYYPNKLHELYLIKRVPRRHQKALEIVRKKEKITVAFFLINVDTWKYDTVYLAFKKTSRFTPIIVICPLITRGDEFMKKEMQKCIDFCIKNKYHFIETLEGLNVVDVKEKLDPDVVFFTNPNALTFPEFLIENYSDKLTCYVPYSFRIDTLYEYEYNSKFVNITWKNFYESAIHKKLAQKYSRNDGENVASLGFPHLDRFFKCFESDVWKDSGKNRKKIIWAPHWTIKGYQNTGLDWSCFLVFYKLFIELAKKYEEEVQFAIKPHPFLRNVLCNDDLWGEIETNSYFEQWNQTSNLQFVDGDYLELFQQSDALIHDSGSFMVEYLMVNKPLAYTFFDRFPKDKFNELGSLAFDVHIPIQSDTDLEQFILDVIYDNDLKKNVREKLIDTHFSYDKEKLVGDKIVNFINDLL
jgi:hypothetical protein